MIKDTKLHKGVVELNKDPFFQGRIKVRLPDFFGEQNDTPTPFLPWCFPMISSPFGGDSSYGGSFIPEEKSEVWVYIGNLELLEPIWYISGFNFEDTSDFHLHFYTKILPELALLDITPKAVYPDMKYQLMPGGICYGSSSKSNEYFIFHPDGSFIFFQDGGDIKIGARNTKIELETISGDISAKTISGDIIIETLTGKIKSKGDWEHDGDFKATGEITAQSESTNISVSTHTHIGNLGSDTAPPTPGT
jgi:hypothetical protein